jgi:hypothetical protein
MRTDWIQQIGPLTQGYLVFPPVFIGAELHQAAYRDQGISGAPTFFSSPSMHPVLIMPQLVVPLWIKTVDEPIRQPKTTEVSTIPTIDYTSWSDGTSAAIFFGAPDPLAVNIDGFIQTPVVNAPVNPAHPLEIFNMPQPSTVYFSTLTAGTVTTPPTYQLNTVVYPFDGVTTNPNYTSYTMPNMTSYSYSDMIWMYLEGKFARTGPSAFQRIDPMLYVDPFGNVYQNPIISQFTSTHVPGNIGSEQITLQLWLET